MRVFKRENRQLGNEFLWTHHISLSGSLNVDDDDETQRQQQSTNGLHLSLADGRGMLFLFHAYAQNLIQLMQSFFLFFLSFVFYLLLEEYAEKCSPHSFISLEEASNSMTTFLQFITIALYTRIWRVLTPQLKSWQASNELNSEHEHFHLKKIKFELLLY